jgi:hypothetical protein
MLWIFQKKIEVCVFTASLIESARETETGIDKAGANARICL